MRSYPYLVPENDDFKTNILSGCASVKEMLYATETILVTHKRKVECMNFINRKEYLRAHRYPTLVAPSSYRVLLTKFNRVVDMYAYVGERMFACNNSETFYYGYSPDRQLLTQYKTKNTFVYDSQKVLLTVHKHSALICSLPDELEIDSDFGHRLETMIMSRGIGSKVIFGRRYQEIKHMIPWYLNLVQVLFVGSVEHHIYNISSKERMMQYAIQKFDGKLVFRYEITHCLCKMFNYQGYIKRKFGVGNEYIPHSLLFHLYERYFILDKKTVVVHLNARYMELCLVAQSMGMRSINILDTLKAESTITLPPGWKHKIICETGKLKISFARFLLVSLYRDKTLLDRTETVEIVKRNLHNAKCVVFAGYFPDMDIDLGEEYDKVYSSYYVINEIWGNFFINRVEVFQLKI
jgi:hypothetical protein